MTREEAECKEVEKFLATMNFNHPMSSHYLRCLLDGQKYGWSVSCVKQIVDGIKQAYNNKNKVRSM